MWLGVKTLGNHVLFCRHILGFPSQELQRGPVLQELHEQLSQQMAFLHLIHWSGNDSLEVSVCVSGLEGSPLRLVS